MSTNKDQESIVVVNKNKLTEDQAKEFENVLKVAAKDKFLGDDGVEPENDEKKRMVIFVKDEIAGFFSPERSSIKGVIHHRAGALFLIPKFRGKGIMEIVLREFFSKHSPGLSWIDDSNYKSISLFKRLGFKQGKQRDHENHKGHWYLKDSPIALEEHSEKLPAWATWVKGA